MEKTYVIWKQKPITILKYLNQRFGGILVAYSKYTDLAGQVYNIYWLTLSNKCKNNKYKEYKQNNIPLKRCFTQYNDCLPT